MENETMLAGVARRVISPPKGIYQIGYGDRVKGNQGIHDDLTATALLLDDGATCLALVACDLLCLNEFIVDRIRKGVVTHGIEPVICCSHTHAGPIAYADKRSRRSRRAYIDGLVESIVAAILLAWQQRAPASLTLSESQADIAVNRRQRTPDGKIIIGENTEGPVDRSLKVLSVYSQDNQRMATLVNFACHGTVLGPDNLLISADWIGAMRARVEDELGGLVLFLQGATADLNPKMGWSDENVWGLLASQGHEVAQAVIAAEQSDSARAPKPVRGDPIVLQRREILLPFEARVISEKPPKDYRRSLPAMAGLPSFIWPLTDLLLNQRYPWRSRLQPGQGDYSGFWSTPLRISTARIGELALVTYGCETFTEIGMQVKEASPAPATLFASVSDGCIGYLPTAEAHNQGGYEVDTAPLPYRFPGRLAPVSAELALQATNQMLAPLWDDNTEHNVEGNKEHSEVKL